MSRFPLPHEAAQPEDIFRSDGYELKFWQYDTALEQQSVCGYTDRFCLTYVYSGNLMYDLFHRQYDLHTGYILIDKPQLEFRLPPAAGVSTIFRFYPDFYRQLLEEEGLRDNFFFANINLLSLVLRSVPEADYLHYRILKNRFRTEKLVLDTLVIDFLYCVLNIISDKRLQYTGDGRLRKYHMAAIERAKDYMHGNLSGDISLKDIAGEACISMFHFSRLFKEATSFSPLQYLLQVRLKHAGLLLKNTALSISEVAAAAGFKKPERFATTFRQTFHTAPNEYRKG